MAELLLERWTKCPTGNPADERVFEILIQDDDVRPASDTTPRTTTLARLQSRGDRSILRLPRQFSLTTGTGVNRIVRATVSTRLAHLDVNISLFGLRLLWYQGGTHHPRVERDGWDIQIAPDAG